MRITVLVLALASLSCGRTRLVNPIPEDASFDGTLDTGRFDSGVDAPSPDVGRDAPPIARGLAEQLTCGLDEDQVLAAAARYTACNDDGITMRGILESWEALVLGIPGFAPSTIGLPPSCDVWRCHASANRCNQVATCLDGAALLAEPCMEGSRQCFGDDSGVCHEGRWLRDISCGDFGASCVGSGCVTADGCEFAGFSTVTTTCDGPDVSLCGARADCAEYNGGSCSDFFLGGEVPVAWCSPDGMSASGDVRATIRCNAGNGRTRFGTVSGSSYVYDCVDNGYGGCDDTGCTR